MGITPSKCSRRDLVAEIAETLKEHDIRLLVYLPSGAPAADVEARKKLGWLWGRAGGWQLPDEPVGGRLVEFQRKWEAVIREWSLRWKQDVSGWWIDGCYFADDEKIMGLTRQVIEKGSVITYDVPIQRSGLIPQPFVAQLRAIGKAVN